MANVPDPKRFIAEKLNQNKSKLRSLLSQMNAKKGGPTNRASKSPRKVTMSPYEKIMLRQLTHDRYSSSPARPSPASRDGNAMNKTARRSIYEQSG